MDNDPEIPLSSLERQAFEYFNIEMESMAAEGYAESNGRILRSVALRVILENSASFNFDAFTPHLAMNYFDRFISRHPLPNVLGRVRKDTVLAAISCLTLAWKMKDESFRFQDLVNLNEDYENDILAMELHILNGLNWSMRAVTPFRFVSFFSEKIPVGRSIKRRTLNEIIIQSQGDICFTKFKPSVIAASALLTGSKFLYSNEYETCKGDILASGYINEEDLETCLQKTCEMCLEKNIQFERNEKFNRGPRRPCVKAEGTSSSISIKEATQAIKNESETSSISGLSMLKDSGTEIDPTLTSRRHGKETMQTISEIMEEAGENENQEMFNFKLKWSSDNPEEWNIHSPDFRPEAPFSDPNDGIRTIAELLEIDSWFVTHPEYVNNSVTVGSRREALKLIKTYLTNVNHDDYLEYQTINVFDVLLSRAGVNLPDTSGFKVFVLVCLIAGWNLLRLADPFPIEHIASEHQLSSELQERLLDQGDQIVQEFKILRLPTNIFVMQISLNLNLDEVFEIAVFEMAYQTVATLAKEDICLTTHRPSVIAAASILVAVMCICPQRFEASKQRIVAICPGIDEGDLKRCIHFLYSLKVTETFETYLKLGPRSWPID